jgi:valyl-tRNA synthetase
MNKENKTLLKALEINYLTLKHPTMPYITASDWNDNSANALTKCIIHFLTYSGFQAERINTMGVYREGKKIQVGENTRQLKGTYTPSTGTKGSADISATIRGRSVKIEVKYGKDRQSEVQKRYQESVEAAGGTYFIARNFDEFMIFYLKFLADMN